MKTIIPLAGYGTRMRPHTWSRAKPLLNVAGKTIIGHLLDLMMEILTDEVIFVVGYKGEEIEAWLRANYPQLEMRFVVQEEALGQAHALWLCRDYLDEGEVLIAFGDGIVEADYSHIPEPGLDGVLLVQPMEDPRTFGVVVRDGTGLVTDFIEKPTGFEHREVIAGIYWFRNGRFLANALNTVITEKRQSKGEYYLVDAYKVMLEQGAKIGAKPTRFWLDAGKPDFMLAANTRLLGLGYGATPDAIERSYAEDFTVIPPVFIDETAVVETAVVGPYASIHAGAVIKNAIVRRSIVDAGARVENCLLDGSLVGEHATITGKPMSLFVGDDSVLEIT